MFDVLTSVNLNNQLMLDTDKINNITPDRVLSPKLAPIDLPVSQPAP